MTRLFHVDPEVAAAIAAEVIRQEDGLEMIASENYVSQAVLEAQGSVLTNKYAEGLPGHRYYGGCEHVDKAEELARSRAIRLFGCAHVNVQPHSGAQANMAVMVALKRAGRLEAGDPIMGMSLTHGGHLTHGSPVNFSGLYFNVAAAYGVDAVTGKIDMNEVRERALAHHPRLIICGGSAYPQIIDFAAFRNVADEVDAVLMADIAHIAGQVAVDLHPDPIPHCHFVTTTIHKTLRGPRGGMVMTIEDFGKHLDSGVFPGTQGGPLMHVIAAKAVALGEALRPEFRAYVEQYLANANVLAEVLVRHGLHVVGGGTANHLMLVDLRPSHGSEKTDLNGKRAEAVLGAAGITVNKNTVPGETRSPFITSGLRIGTPALTTRGMREDELRVIGGWIVEVLQHPDDEALARRIRGEIRELCAQFPIYPHLRPHPRLRPPHPEDEADSGLDSGFWPR